MGSWAAARWLQFHADVAEHALVEEHGAERAVARAPQPRQSVAVGKTTRLESVHAGRESFSASPSPFSLSSGGSAQLRLTARAGLALLAKARPAAKRDFDLLIAGAVEGLTARAVLTDDGLEIRDDGIEISSIAFDVSRQASFGGEKGAPVLTVNAELRWLGEVALARHPFTVSGAVTITAPPAQRPLLTSRVLDRRVKSAARELKSARNQQAKSLSSITDARSAGARKPLLSKLDSSRGKASAAEAELSRIGALGLGTMEERAVTRERRAASDPSRAKVAALAIRAARTGDAVVQRELLHTLFEIEDPSANVSSVEPARRLLVALAAIGKPPLDAITVQRLVQLLLETPIVLDVAAALAAAVGPLAVKKGVPPIRIVDDLMILSVAEIEASGCENRGADSMVLDDEQGTDETIVASERDEGRGDSRLAVRSLESLLGDGPDAARIAEVEALIVIGRRDTTAANRQWASRLRQLPDHAKRGYQLALARTQSVSLAAAIIELSKQDSMTPNWVAIVVAFRAAGKPRAPSAVAALARLVRANGGTLEAAAPAAERLIDPASSITSIKELRLDIQLSYRDALGVLSPTKNSGTTVAVADRTTTDRTESSIARSSAVGGGSPGRPGKTEVNVSYEAIAGVADNLKNARLGAALLMTYAGVDAAFAWWYATNNMKAPDPAAELLDLNRVSPKPSSYGGGVEGYAIREQKGEGAITSPAAIDEMFEEARRKDSLPSIDDAQVTLWRDEGLYQTSIAVLLATDWQATATAYAEAGRFQQLVEALEEEIRTKGHSPLLFAKLQEAKRERNASRKFGYQLHRGEKKPGDEQKKFAARIETIDKQLDAATSGLELAEKRKLELEKEVEVLRIEAKKASGGATMARHGTTGAHSKLSLKQKELADARRNISELERYRLATEEHREQMRRGAITPGMRFPRTRLKKRDALLAKVYRNSDGNYQFTSKPTAQRMAFGASINRMTSDVITLGSFALDIQPFIPAAIAGPISTRLTGLAKELDQDATELTFHAQQVLDPLEVMMIDVIVNVAATVVITVVTAGAGSAVAGARGASAALAIVGAGMSYDKGPAAMLQGALVWGLVPFVKAYGKTALQKVSSAVFLGSAHEAVSQVDIQAAVDSIARGETIAEAKTVAMKNLNLATIAAGGLLEGSLVFAGSITKTDGKKQPTSLVESEGEVFRLGNGEWKKVSGKTDGGAESVKLNVEEMAAVRAHARDGNTAALEQVVASGRARQQTIDSIPQGKKDVEAEIMALERSKKPNLDRLELLYRAEERFDALAEYSNAAQAGSPIGVELVSAVGVVPPGYMRTKGGASYELSPGRVAKESDESAQRFALAAPLIERYKSTIKKMRIFSKQLGALGKSAQTRAASLRESLRSLGEMARQLRAQVFKLLTPPTATPKPDASNGEGSLVTPAKPVADLTQKDRVGDGGQGDVYRISGQPFVVKVPATPSGLEMAQRGVFEKRYGGLGAENGSVVLVHVDGEPRQGIRMPYVAGKTLARSESISLEELAKFDAYVAQARGDDVILADFGAHNILVRDSGGVVFVDSPVWNFADFAEQARRFDPSLSDDVAREQWKVAKENFDYAITSARAKMRQNLASREIDEVPRGKSIDGGMGASMKVYEIEGEPNRVLRVTSSYATDKKVPKNGGDTFLQEALDTAAVATVVDGERVAARVHYVVTKGDAVVGFVQDRVRGKTLYSLRQTGDLSEEQYADAVSQARRQLRAMHRDGSVHGDPNTRNILVDIDESGAVKSRFIDFGGPPTSTRDDLNLFEESLKRTEELRRVK